jgi:hypothetical protein
MVANAVSRGQRLRENERKSPQEASAEIARAIRTHLKAGKTRSEIIEAENLTPKQYRWGLMVLGKFPKQNIEAFSTFLADEIVRIEQILDDMKLARHAGDFRALAAFHKLLSEIRVGSMELAMKLGLLQKAAEKLKVETVQEYRVGFGDEGNLVTPRWPEQEGN